MDPVERISRREHEVLHEVGLRLSNAEIADKLFISVRTVESHVSSLLRKYGVHDRSALVEKAREVWRSRGIPTPGNSFVGREEELAVAARLLDEQRLVSIVGPGGSGKTRLALQLARSSPQPVFVDMGPSDPESVLETIATALSIGIGGRANLLAAIGLSLEREPHTLILDNCDLVTDHVRPIVSMLLGRLKDLRIVATSRVPLHTPEEGIIQLGPLHIGDESGGAVRLFLDRAHVAAPTVTLDEDLHAIEAICRRLDGLPLAIELAAARVRHYSAEALARLLEERLDVLSDPTTADRHATLSATFQWSWDALEPAERDALARLAAIPGAFDLELAEAVGVENAAMMLTRLLDRSMITPGASGTHQRFHLLVPIREFVSGRSEEETRRDAAERHARLFGKRARTLASAIRTDDSRQTNEEARELIPPVTAAISWGLSNDPPLALSTGTALAVILEQVGPTVASLAVISRLANDPAILSLAGPDDLAAWGFVLAYGDVPKMSELAERAMDLAVEPRDRLAANLITGMSAAYSGDTRKAAAHLEAAEALAAQLDDHWSRGAALQGRGIAFSGATEGLESALDAFRSSMESFSMACDGMHVNNVRFMMAAAVAENGGGPRDDALRWAEESIRYANNAGLRHEWAHATLAWCSLVEAVDRAGALREALDVFRSVGDLRCVARAQLSMARLRGDDEEDLTAQALSVAVDAGDLPRQRAALERMVASYSTTGDLSRAAQALGALASIIGEAAAMAEAPPEMLERSDQWRTSFAEGRAKGAAGITSD